MARGTTLNGYPAGQFRRAIVDLVAMLTTQAEARAAGGAARMVGAAKKTLADAQALAPVDTGNLVNSGYIVWTTGHRGAGRQQSIKRSWAPPNPKYTNSEGYAEAMTAFHRDAVTRARPAAQQVTGKRELVIVIGFSAYYAVWVHEGHQVYNTGGYYKGIKFLERALTANQHLFP